MDHLGVVSADGVQSLKLPRPKGESTGCGNFLGWIIAAALFGAFRGLAKGEWAPALARTQGWSRADAESAIEVLTLVVFAALWIGAVQIWKRKGPGAAPLRLELVRRGAPEEFENQHFEVWRADTLKARAIGPSFIFLLGACFLLGVSIQPTPFKQLILISIALVLLYISFRGVEEVQKPLLLLNSQHIQVGNRIFQWEKVQKVEIEHLLDATDSYSCTSWTFVDEGGKQIARAVTPENRCWQGREEEMLAFIAQMLGNEVSPVVHPAPIWL